MKVRPAFTLLETVIGLVIVCSTIMISVYNLKDYQAHIEERQAIEWFKNSFKSTFNYCYLNHKTANVYLMQNQNRIKFDIQKDNQNKSHNKELKLPRGLKIDNQKKYIIGVNGQGGPAVITFHSTLTNKIYSYTVQMGWGEISENKA